MNAADHHSQPANPQPIISNRALIMALVTLLAVAGPLFVCMPVNSDTALFDVQADCVVHGGVLYRDILEPNLPGVVWIHQAIRSIAGWTTESMRLVDLLLFAVMTVIFGRLLRSSGKTLLFAVTAGLFYLSCNEWCHCQRDTWLLLPTAAAVWVRIRRNSTAGKKSQLILSIAEGLLWGCAFWIKPHIAVPVICVMTFDVARSRDRMNTCKVNVAVILGGFIAAVPGIWWMVASGAWPHFWEMMLDWNPEYLQAGRERQSLHRWILMFRRFYPWWCVHLVALPVAIQSIRGVLSRRKNSDKLNSASDATGMLSTVYLGWLVQSLALQHAMDYIHVPAIILGILILSSWNWQLPVNVRRPVVAAFLVLTLLASPTLKPQRIAQWTGCWTEGSSPAVRAALAHGNFPRWENLVRVAEFLKSQDVRDGQLTCLNVHSIHIFRELDVQPATRYWCVSILQELFPSRANQIEQEIRHSDARFIVTEAIESGVLAPTATGTAGYPWNLPVVFAAGSYRVHAASRISDHSSAAAKLTSATKSFTR